MASNKNQHFVPRCYLKPFTLDGANVAINLFNIDRSRFIQNAPVKNQCSHDYFYGEDLALERALQASEGAYASALSEITKPGYRLTEEHRELLRRFWLLQHLRTEAASRRAVQMSAGLAETVGAGFENFRLTIRDAVLDAMHTFVEAMDIVDDLKVCLVRNRSSTPFVTSDDPAVMTNRWRFEHHRQHRKALGLCAAGALLLLPLTPRILCLAYDGDVYSIPNDYGWVDVRRERDISAFTQHQHLNCRANIYFHEWATRQQIQDDFEAVAALRPKSRHRIHYAVLDQSVGDADRFRW